MFGSGEGGLFLIFVGVRRWLNQGKLYSFDSS